MHLAISLKDFIFISISVFTFSLYNIYAKRFTQNRMALLFWVTNLTYAGFIITYVIRNFLLGQDPHAFHELLFTFTLINIPLYLLMGIAFVTSLWIFNWLLNHFDISLVFAMSQVSLLFTTLGYLTLGDSLKWSTVIAITLVFVGALISSFKEINWRNPLASLAHVPPKLFWGSIIQGLLATTVALITFIITQETKATQLIMHTLKHTYSMPFSFFNPFYLNVGVRFFYVLIFIFYVWHSKQGIKSVFAILKQHGLFITLIGTLNFISSFMYQEAYLYTADKNVLSALTKLTVPTLLILSTVMLHEKLTTPKIIGATLIVIGGLIATFF